MGEVGIEVEHDSPLETGPGGSSFRVLRMLTDLENDPLALIVCAPYPSFVLETRASCLGRWMDTPPLRGRELLDGSPLDHDGERLFKDESCRKGPDRGSLSLERDRRGGIVDGLAGHEELGGIRGVEQVDSLVACV